MPHFCSDELIAILSVLPFIGVAFSRLHAWILLKFPKHKSICHHQEAMEEPIPLVNPPAPIDLSYETPVDSVHSISPGFIRAMENAGTRPKLIKACRQNCEDHD